MNDKDRDQFEQWQKQWDAAAETFANEFADKVSQKAKESAPVSWLTGAPLDRDYQAQPVEDNPDWRDIYWRSQNIDGLITDDVKYDDGPAKPKAAFGAFTPTKTNPTTQSSTGKDQEREDGEGIRVTKNWSDSDDLRELESIKRKAEELERKCHEKEVETEKPSSLRKELESLWSQIKSVSEKINGSPEVDVT